MTGRAWELSKEPEPEYAFAELPDAFLAARTSKNGRLNSRIFSIVMSLCAFMNAPS